MSLPALIKVLRTDYRDVDITKSLLETLIILCTPDEKVMKTQWLRRKDNTAHFFFFQWALGS